MEKMGIGWRAWDVRMQRWFVWDKLFLPRAHVPQAYTAHSQQQRDSAEMEGKLFLEVNNRKLLKITSQALTQVPSCSPAQTNT